MHGPSSCHTGPGSYARHRSRALPRAPVPLCPFPCVPLVYDLFDVEGGVGGAMKTGEEMQGQPKG